MSSTPATYGLCAARGQRVRGPVPPPKPTRLDVASTARRLDDDVDRLRPQQREAMEAVLQHDTLAVLATGSGKTLVYQVAADLLPGPTVVVSPTLALHADQVAALRESGAGAEQLNGSVRGRRRDRVLEAFGSGELEFLLVTPEQLATPDVVERLAAAGPSLFVVDEAHCVSAWGEDFRPEYAALGPAVEQLGRPRVLELTATASPAVRAEIVAALGMAEPRVVVGDVDRREIWLGVEECRDEDHATELLVELLSGRTEDEVALVYVATRRRTEELAEVLGAHGLAARAYHGAMRVKERDEVHRGFRDGSIRLVVATSAFGLGVDKEDVRLVLHADPTESLDDYWQEAGRAGRDGEAARAILLTRPEGYGLRRYFAAGTGASREDLDAVTAALADGPSRVAAIAERSGLSPTRVRRALNALTRTGSATQDRAEARLLPRTDRRWAVERATAFVEQLQARRETGVALVRRYAETTDCRRRLVLELLGEEHPEPCGRCDSCDAGTSTSATDRPHRIGARVRHEEFGPGVVTAYEGDRVVVLFEEHGYRTLDLELVMEHDLLQAAT
jgi:ATP-dependent DNA helicase RecQ